MDCQRRWLPGARRTESGAQSALCFPPLPPGGAAAPQVGARRRLSWAAIAVEGAAGAHGPVAVVAGGGGAGGGDAGDEGGGAD